jgi:hypothetical protein
MPSCARPVEARGRLTRFVICVARLVQHSW